MIPVGFDSPCTSPGHPSWVQSVLRTILEPTQMMKVWLPCFSGSSVGTELSDRKGLYPSVGSCNQRCIIIMIRHAFAITSRWQAGSPSVGVCLSVRHGQPLEMGWCYQWSQSFRTERVRASVSGSCNIRILYRHGRVRTPMSGSCNNEYFILDRIGLVGWLASIVHARPACGLFSCPAAGPLTG